MTISARVLCTMGLQLRLFCLGHSELVQRLLEIVEEGIPLAGGDLQLLMRIAHRAAGV